MVHKRVVLSCFVALGIAGGLIAPLPAHAGTDPATKLLFTSSVPSRAAGNPFNITVRATNNSNVTDTNFTGQITLSASAVGGSTFEGGNKVANAVNGSFTFTNLTLNNAANGYTLTAEASGLTDGTSTSFNIVATHLGFTTTISNVKSGTSFSAEVEGLDEDENTAENFTTSILISAAATGGSQFLGGPKSQAATAGVSSFSNLQIGNAANAYTITATAGGVTGDTSNPFNVTAASLVVTPTIPNARAGDSFGITVQARDSSSNNAENFTGSVTIAAAAVGGSNFVGGDQTESAVAGVATFSETINNAASGYTVTASGPAGSGITNGASNSFNVAARQLVVTTVIANQESGTAFDVAVSARDADNNVAENFTGTTSLNAAATGGSNFVGGTKTLAAVSGAVTFDDVVLNNAANGYTVTATAPGLFSGTSNSFNVTASHLTVNTISNARSGDAFGVTVQARDASNAIAENFTGLVGLSASATGGSNFSPTPSQSAVAGIATFNGLTLNNAADGYTITASGPAGSGITDGVSNSFNVTAHHLTVTSVLTDKVSGGSPFSVTVEARDANNAIAENFVALVTLAADASSGGSTFVGGSPSVNAVSGVVTFNGLVINNAADDYQVTASATGPTSGFSNTFNVTAHHLGLLPVSDVRSGDGFSVTVEARDADNNVAENYTQTLSLAAVVPTGGSDFETQPTFEFAIAGQAVFEGLVLNNAADGYNVKGSGGKFDDVESNTFDVTARKLAVTSDLDDVTVGDEFDVAVSALDGDDNVAENFDGLITLLASAIGGSNFDGGSPSQNAVAGQATFQDMTLDDAASQYEVTASSFGLIDGISNNFDVEAIKARRTLILNLTKHLKVKGDLNTPGPVRCVANKNVKIQKKNNAGKWVTIKPATTGDNGVFTTNVPDREGKYRALAKKLNLKSPSTVCGAAKSPIRSHSHN